MSHLPIRSPLVFFLTAAIIAATSSLFSCSAGGERSGETLVAVDAAFQLGWPSLAESLSRLSVPGHPLRYLSVGLAEGPARVLEEMAAAKAAGRSTAAVVASPLLAASLAGGALDTTPLLVPEWPGPMRPGLIAVVTDPIPAYAAAGRALGSYIARLRRLEPGSPTCGLLYVEAPARPRATLEAFAAAYATASGDASLLVRELPSSSDSKAGPKGPETAAEAAVRELLGSDLRALMVALGPGGPAALRAADRPGIVLGADLPGPERLPSLAFRIKSDVPGLVRALEEAVRRAERGERANPSVSLAAEAPGGEILRVPALLEAGAAAALHSDGISFGSILEDTRRLEKP